MSFVAIAFQQDVEPNATGNDMIRKKSVADTKHDAFAAIRDEDNPPDDIGQDFNDFIDIHLPHLGTCDYVHQNEDSNKHAHFNECFGREPEC